MEYRYFTELAPESQEHASATRMAQTAFAERTPGSAFDQQASKLAALPIKEILAALVKEGHNALFAFDDKQAIGMVAFQTYGSVKHGYLVYTHPSERGKSTAKEIALELIRRAKKEGHDIQLGAGGHIAVTALNRSLKRFEAEIGFKMRENGHIETQ